MQITSGKVLYQYRYRYWSLILNARSIVAYHSARRLFDHHARPCILLMHACRTLSLMALDTVPYISLACLTKTKNKKPSPQY